MSKSRLDDVSGAVAIVRLRVDTLGNASQQPTVSTDRNRSKAFAWVKISGCLAKAKVYGASDPSQG